MRDNSFKANDLVILTFIILSCIVVVIGIFFFPDKNIYYSLTISVLGGFYFLYIGIRNLRQNQQQIRWYTQSSIIVSIAFFVGLLWNLLRFGIIPAFPSNIFIENVLVILGLVLFLIAGYIFLRGNLRDR